MSSYPETAEDRRAESIRAMQQDQDDMKTNPAQPKHTPEPWSVPGTGIIDAANNGVQLAGPSHLATIPTPSIPTPRTDAAKFARQQWTSRNLSAQLRGSHLDSDDPEPPEGFKIAYQLEAELSTALASLAAARAQCVVKDEALTYAVAIFDQYANMHMAKSPAALDKAQRNQEHARQCVLALADNCAAPWLARYDAMRVALEKLRDFSMSYSDDCNCTGCQLSRIARKALEDEPK